MTQETSPREVAQSYWLVEAARDLEAVREHYHPDAVFQYPGGTLVGWENIAGYYRDSFAQFPGLEVDIVHEVSRGSEAALEWSAVLIDREGTRFPLRGINLVHVASGKFRWVHAHFDLSGLPSQTQPGTSS